MSTADYMPFLSVEALVKRIFADAGYELRSEFMAGEEFRSLCMSGRYRAASTSRLRSSMWFCAGRTSEATASADSLGRVYVSPLVLTLSLIHISEPTRR